MKKAIKYLKGLACTGVIAAAILAGMNKAKASIVTWQYEDDFSTEKATSDNYNHSIFWPELAYPPAEPRLYYTEAIPPAGMLALEGYYVTEEDAFLAYAFPVGNVLAQVDSGIFELDVLLPDYPDPTPPPYYCPRYILYELSEDGVNWTNPVPLVEGHNQIPLLPSSSPFTYVRLSANYARIDNISVTVHGLEVPEPSILALLGTGLAGLLVCWRKRILKSN